MNANSDARPPAESAPTAGLPAGIDLLRHRDFAGRNAGQWVRRGVVALLAVFVGAGLLGVFGQGASTSTAAGDLGTLTVTAPTGVRGGLLYQVRIRVDARAAIADPVLVLDRGWYDEATLNTLEPEPAATSSDADHVRLRFDPLAAGSTLVVYMDFQANPTNVGSRDADVSLYDGARPVATVSRTLTDFP